MRPGLRAAAAALLAGLLAAGCNGPVLLKTKGRLLKNGAPVIPHEGELVHVIFVPVTEGDQRARDYFAAEFHAADGTFQVAGKDGRGMPPGKYRVWVEVLKNKRDLLKGAFDEEHTPFVRDVDTKTDEVILDLDKPRG
jgi:hypothetical protein